MLIDRHEGHTRQFEQLRVNRIKVDEKQEGSIFRFGHICYRVSMKEFVHPSIDPVGWLVVTHFFYIPSY